MKYRWVDSDILNYVRTRNLPIITAHTFRHIKFLELISITISFPSVSFSFLFFRTIVRVFRLTLIYSYARDRLNVLSIRLSDRKHEVMTLIQFLIENFNFNFNINSLLNENIKI